MLDVRDGMASLRAVPSIYAFFQQYFFRLLSICIFSPPTFSITSLRSKPSGHATAAFNLSTFFSIYQLFLDFQLSPHQLGRKVSKGWPKKCTVSVLKREILQGLEEKITLMIQSAMRKFLVKVKKRKRVGKLWCGNLVCAATKFLNPLWIIRVIFFSTVENPRPNCIPARRSSLGPPPGGRHRT